MNCITTPHNTPQAAQKMRAQMAWTNLLLSDVDEPQNPPQLDQAGSQAQPEKAAGSNYNEPNQGRLCHQLPTLQEYFKQDTSDANFRCSIAC
jgi:hypothetical protein